MATGYNDTLNTAYMPVPLSIPNYTGPTGGNWMNWTVNANTIQAVGPTGATGTTMTLAVPSGGIIQGIIGGTRAMLITPNNVYLGQGAGWAIEVGYENTTSNTRNYAPWYLSSAPSSTWYDIALSSTGKYQTVVNSNGGISVSSNYGSTWNPVPDPNNIISILIWDGIAVSSTGQYQTAAAVSYISDPTLSNGGGILNSSDYGTTWIPNSSTTNIPFISVAMSSTGQYQTALSYNGSSGILTSSDYGITWYSVPYSIAPWYYNWTCVTMSSTGQYQTAVGAILSSMYTSYDYGKTWAPVSYPTRCDFRGVAMSFTGQYQTAVVSLYAPSLAGIYISSDYGYTWKPSTSGIPVSSYWFSVTMSSSGKYQTAAVHGGGGLYASSDYGNSWALIQSVSGIPPVVANWENVAMSSDGNYQTAVVSGGGIYTNVSTVVYQINSVGVGSTAGTNNQGSNSIAIGNSAGLFNQGPGSVAIGYYAAGYTGFTGGYTGGQGSNSIAIGYQAGYQNDSSSVIVAPYVQANSIYEYGSSYALPGTANNCVGSFSYNGQYTGFCINTSTTIYLSSNYGATFNTYVLGNNIFGYNVSSTGQYQICTTNVATAYYSSNYGGSFATITLPTLCSYGGYLGSRFISSNGQVICMFPLSGPTGVPLYSNNGGSIGTPSFSVFPATSGLYLTSAVYGQSSMDTTGQYIICPSQSNSIYALYYSNNGTAGVANVTFTNLVSYSPANGLPSTTYFGSASISGNAKYMLVGVGIAGPFITYISSNANATPPSNITFSPINELPSNLSDYRSCDISNTGQYMAFLCTISTTNACVFVSYNYGVNWSAINGVGNMVHLSMSLNGNFIMALPNTASSTPATGVLLILSTIPSNTNNIAIGYNAGYMNQQGNTVAIGANAGYQNQPVNSVAIGNGAGSIHDPYIYGVAEQINTLSGQSQSASVLSYTGQSIIIVSSLAGYATIGSNNYGESFSNMLFNVFGAGNNTNGAIVSMSSFQYLITSGYNNVNTPVYYSANGTSAITTISFTSLSSGGQKLPLNGTGTSIHYGINPIVMSSNTGQYILVGNYYAAANTIGNQLYYSTNGGTASTAISQITFTNIGSNPGLSSIVTAAGGWFQFSMSADGKYIIAPYSLNYQTGQSYLFYSTNGNNIPSLVTFTSLAPTCGITLLQQNYTNGPYFRGSAMSSNGQYILVSFFSGTGSPPAINSCVFLSSNGGALSTPSTITFTNLVGNLVNGVPNGFETSITATNYNTCAMSFSGQYMVVAQYAGTSFYVSTNYGLNWLKITCPASLMHVGMSGDGTKIITSFPASSANTVYSYTLQQNAVSNMISIGYNAGYYNQPSGSFYVSTSSMRNQNNGQTSNYSVLYSTTSGEVFYTTAKTFVIDHPSDESRYLVHSCLEGPEVGVYYRGTAEITNGESVTVVLPEYVETFAYDFTVEVTPVQEDEGNNLSIPIVSAGLVKDGRFTIYGTTNGLVHWNVYGKRMEVVIEPEKYTVQREGEGPYVWLTTQRDSIVTDDDNATRK